LALQGHTPPPEAVQGDVVLNCDIRRDGGLNNCRLVSETPPGRGFGAAALRTSPSIKVRNRPAGSGDVPVALRMSREEADAAGVTPPGTPPLVEFRGLDFARSAPPREKTEPFAPPRARRHAGAALQCTVQADGRLAACRVLQADGPEYGRAAIRAAEAVYRLPPRDSEGRPTAGRPFNLEITWGRPGPPGPASECPRWAPDCGWGLRSRR
jgi:TonB family protein